MAFCFFLSGFDFSSAVFFTAVPIPPSHVCVCVCVCCVCACVRACVRVCVCVIVKHPPIPRWIGALEILFTIIIIITPHLNLKRYDSLQVYFLNTPASLSQALGDEPGQKM